MTDSTTCSGVSTLDAATCSYRANSLNAICAMAAARRSSCISSANAHTWWSHSATLLSGSWVDFQRSEVGFTNSNIGDSARNTGYIDAERMKQSEMLRWEPTLAWDVSPLQSPALHEHEERPPWSRRGKVRRLFKLRHGRFDIYIL